MRQVVVALTCIARYRQVLLEDPGNKACACMRAHTHTHSSPLRTWDDVFSVLPAIIILAWETNSVSIVSETLH